MTAKYNVIPRDNPSNPDAPVKYYPTAQVTDRLGAIDAVT